ncbi:MAG: peptidylprolyl isomerase [Phycisphaerales bacterium]|nr:peptidylprolyl isomerase [Phycisphaerales bacterium]|tara:strand:- start:3800 stop:5278 length:1479 start_codon:yes stop_codon:yes gene_type:complete
MLRISSRYLIVGLALLLAAMAQTPDDRWDRLEEKANTILKEISEGVLVGDSKKSAMMELLQENRLFLAEHPDNESAWLMSASLCGQLGDDECLDTSLRAIMRMNPRNVQAGLQWAAHYTNDNRLDRSLDVLNELLELNPTSLMFWNAWTITATTHDPSLIQSRFRTLMIDAASPERPIAFLTALQKSDPWTAADLGEQLLEWSPEHPDVLLCVARGLRSANQFKSAADIIKTMPAEMLKRPDVAYLHSDCLYADHRFQEAYDIMSSIDLDSIESKPGLARRLKFMLPLRKQALDAWQREQKLRTLQTNSTDNPLVRITIDGKPVELELFAGEAPNTVAAFLATARRGDYEQLPFMRIHTGFRSITGETSRSAPYTLPIELDEDDSRDFFTGSVSMYMNNPANPDSSTNQLCLYHFPAPHLNGTRNVFGRVTSGLDVVREMREGAVLESVEILRAPEIPIDPIVIDSSGTQRPMSQVMNELDGGTSQPGNASP